MRLDLRALGAAVLVDAMLAVLALHGGPHGSLGPWPWTLQLPGILLVFFVSGETHFGIFALVRRMRQIHHI